LIDVGFQAWGMDLRRRLRVKKLAMAERLD
jgi:hypothetical protein